MKFAAMGHVSSHLSDGLADSLRAYLLLSTSEKLFNSSSLIALGLVSGIAGTAGRAA
jgi:hypothetical protein